MHKELILIINNFALIFVEVLNLQLNCQLVTMLAKLSLGNQGYYGDYFVIVIFFEREKNSNDITSLFLEKFLKNCKGQIIKVGTRKWRLLINGV